MLCSHVQQQARTERVSDEQAILTDSVVQDIRNNRWGGCRRKAYRGIAVAWKVDIINFKASVSQGHGQDVHGFLAGIQAVDNQGTTPTFGPGKIAIVRCRRTYFQDAGFSLRRQTIRLHPGQREHRGGRDFEPKAGHDAMLY